MKKLATYRQKRDFKSTPEPKPKVASSRGRPIFVVQKHQARALHYDFRLEIEGVLKSWAVPKGPSNDPKIKRLAVMTEDHPMEYRKFSGRIPKGEYGAGKVEIWDGGTYVSFKNKDGKFLEKDVMQGQLEFELFGKKLTGKWVLFKFGKQGKNWILKKAKN